MGRERPERIGDGPDLALGDKPLLIPGHVDPTVKNRQFCDSGNQYRTAIFYHDATQRRLAEESKRALEKAHGWRIVTEIVPAGEFYPAEEYHQSYYKKNPLRYKFYRAGCGRDKRLREVWGESK